MLYHNHLEENDFANEVTLYKNNFDLANSTNLNKLALLISLNYCNLIYLLN